MPQAATRLSGMARIAFSHAAIHIITSRASHGHERHHAKNARAGRPDAAGRSGAMPRHHSSASLAYTAFCGAISRITCSVYRALEDAYHDIMAYKATMMRALLNVESIAILRHVFIRTP